MRNYLLLPGSLVLVQLCKLSCMEIYLNSERKYSQIYLVSDSKLHFQSIMFIKSLFSCLVLNDRGKEGFFICFSAISHNSNMLCHVFTSCVYLNLFYMFLVSSVLSTESFNKYLLSGKQNGHISSVIELWTYGEKEIIK